MKEIILTQGKVALVDDTDFEKFGAFKWHAMRRPARNFYAARNVGKNPNQKKVYLHGEILGVKGTDHINGNGLDCRRGNLRPATYKQNSRAFRRKSPGASSQFRGVSWFHRDSKWQAKLKTGGRNFHLGLFRVEEDAARAYDKKAIELGFFKEALNFSNN